MALLRRSAEGAEAVYARVLDGVTLWLAVRTTADMLVLRADGRDVELPTEAMADPTGTLLTARVPLAELLLPSGGLVVEVLAGRGRRAVPVHAPGPVPDGPTAIAPSGPDWTFRPEAEDGRLRIRCEATPPSVPVLDIEDTDHGVTLTLPLAAGTEVELRGPDGPVGTLTTRAGGHVDLPADLALPDGDVVTLWAEDAPVTRRADVLARPNQAVALPAPGAGTELRWQPNGRLALRSTTEAAR